MIRTITCHDDDIQVCHCALCVEVERCRALAVSEASLRKQRDELLVALKAMVHYFGANCSENSIEAHAAAKEAIANAEKGAEK